MKKTKRSILKCLALAVVALPLALTPVLNTAINASAARHEAPEFGNYFTSDYGTRAEALKASTKINEEITSEGFTLLKNEDNAMPLGENAKISLFGKNSARMLTGGSGSGAGGGGGESVSLQASLAEAGFSVNPTLVNFYNDNTKSGSGRGSAPGNGSVSPGYNTGETPVASYTEDVKSSFAEYGDAAVVIFSRIGGEGFDLPRSMKWNGSSYSQWGNDVNQPVPGARDGDDHYLQLDQNEADLLKFCGENFYKVIVLLNTGSQFECGFLDDPGHYGYHENVKGALWIGYPGGTGIRALGKILKGEINPSGHTVDTYARDFKADPTWYNFANNMMEGDSSKKGNQYSNLPGSGGNGGGGHRNNYVIYKEGIYMGYRYYETRGFVEGADAWNGKLKNGSTTEAWESWYDAHVVYPFGHGLSYTTFTQEIIDQSLADNAVITETDTVELTVRVTNTGTVAGKEVVQLYYTAPYITNGIEKSHVVLGGFEKTDIIQPGEHEDVKISIAVRDMASYDWSDANGNEFKGYELDAGDYEIKIMENSHDVLDSVTYNVAETIKCAGDSKTGNEVHNRFDTVSEYLTEDLGEKYMSRADFEGTFPKTAYRLEASQEIIDGLNAQYNTALDPDTPDKPYYSATMPTTGAKNGIKLQDLYGKAYDDPMWSDFLDQLTAGQLKDLVVSGAYGSGQNYSDLGITRTINADGPAGFSVGAPGGSYALYCCDTVLASTWNKELAEKKGNAIGNEALWARVGGWYAPAVNIHRSPFSGRNFEYFSEDGYLTGMMAAGVVKGAQDYGVFCYVKHFGLNDQEANRCGLLTWANEQSMREIYFKGFELTVKVGETRAMMSALNRIGWEWAGGCWELLTGLLRREWGFNGCVVTDSYSDAWGIGDWMIRAGGNLALGYGNIRYDANSTTTISCLREMAHGLLYAHANSLAMNTAAKPTTPDKIDSFQSVTLNAGVLGGQYSASVATAELSPILYPGVDNSGIVYSLNASSTLPAGLEILPDGTITGVPEEEVSNHGFVVDATYDGYTKSAEFVITIINSNGSIVYAANTQLGTVLVGEACELSVAGAEIYKPDASQEEIDAYPEVEYELANGSLLPEGLALTADGKVVGTPTKVVSGYKFAVVASALGYRGVTLEFTLTVGVELAYETETAKTLPVGKYGATYVEQLDLATCKNEVTYTLKDGSELPEGLTLTKAGFIVGTLKEVVTDHAFTVVASAANAAPVEREYKLTVALSFSEFELVDGKEGEEYFTFVSFAQGVGMVKYAATGLPEGITLTEDGILSGNAAAGVYEITITAEAEGFLGDSVTLMLYIANGDVEAPAQTSIFDQLTGLLNEFINMIIGIFDTAKENLGCNGTVGLSGLSVLVVGMACAVVLKGKKND